MSEMLEREKKRKADSPAERKQQGSVSELFNLQSNIEIQNFFCFLPIARESYLYWQLFFHHRGNLGKANLAGIRGRRGRRHRE